MALRKPETKFDDTVFHNILSKREQSHENNAEISPPQGMQLPRTPSEARQGRVQVVPRALQRPPAPPSQARQEHLQGRVQVVPRALQGAGDGRQREVHGHQLRDELVRRGHDLSARHRFVP